MSAIKHTVPDQPIFTGIQASYHANRLTGLNVKYKGSDKVNEKMLEGRVHSKVYR